MFKSRIRIKQPVSEQQRRNGRWGEGEGLEAVTLLQQEGVNSGVSIQRRMPIRLIQIGLKFSEYTHYQRKYWNMRLPARKFAKNNCRQLNHSKLYGRTKVWYRILTEEVILNKIWRRRLHTNLEYSQKTIIQILVLVGIFHKFTSY